VGPDGILKEKVEPRWYLARKSGARTGVCRKKFRAAEFFGAQDFGKLYYIDTDGSTSRGKALCSRESTLEITQVLSFRRKRTFSYSNHVPDKNWHS
jgi:hypothetical protein